jgi:hypothetical protein
VSTSSTTSACLKNGLGDSAINVIVETLRWSPALRRALLCLEGEQVKLEKTVAASRSQVVFVPPPTNLQKLFRRKFERLEETLNSEPDVRTKAAPILRTLIDEIVLHPCDKRGRIRLRSMASPARCSYWLATCRLLQIIG